MATILSISYDPLLLATRQLLLETRGYKVTSAEGFAEAIELCGPEYDLIIMGHSIPRSDKRAIIAELRNRGCQAPVLGLLRGGERPIAEVTDAVEPEPGEMLDRVQRILASHAGA